MIRRAGNRPGPVVLVTAAGSGIGLSIAAKFARHRFSVAICDISEEALEKATETAPDLTVFRADVGDSDAVQELVTATIDRLGPIQVLINNAGIAGPMAPVDGIATDDWQNTINTNLSGAFYAARAVTPAMKKDRRGCIINIITASVRTGMVNRLPYLASKSGLYGMTRALARELGPYNIRCNAILPGVVAGERSRRIFEQRAQARAAPVSEIEQEATRFVSMRTQVTPQEVADTAFFLASDSGRHISGQFIGVCGNLEWEA